MSGRILGGLLMLGCVLTYEPAGTSELQRLLLPLAAAIAAALLLQNVLAVTLTATLLLCLQSDWSGVFDPAAHSDWISRGAYPLLALVSGTASGVILLRRFKGYITATRSQRTVHRSERGRPGEPHEP